MSIIRGEFLDVVLGQDFPWIVNHYGVRPAEFSGVSLISSMFLHAFPGHLVGNMLFLYAFGRLMNRRLGNICYPCVYLISGVIGTIVYVIFNLHSSTPLIGASGAISGVMGLFCSVAPWTDINVWYFWWLLYRAEFGSFAVPSIWGIGVWIAYQFLWLVFIGSSSVAILAHLGGFASGALLGLLFQYDVLEERSGSGRGSGRLEFVEQVSDDELEKTNGGSDSENE